MKNYKLNDFEMFLEKQEKIYIKENQLTKEQFISLLTCMCSAGLSITTEGLTENISMLIAIASGLNWYKEERNNKNKIMHHLTNEGLNYIEDTEEYQECKKLYNFFLEETAELFIKLSANKEPLLLGILHADLLHNGLLSKEHKFSYYDYKKDSGFAHDIKGARICSGTGVCRHIAKNAVDLYRILGYTATYDPVRTLNEKSIYLKHEKLLNIINPSPNHVVAGIIGTEGKFVIDPTNYCVANINENEKLATTLTGKLAYYFNQTDIYSKNIDLEIQSYEKFKKAPKRIITEEEYTKTKEEETEIIQYNYIEIAKYLIRTEPLVEKIAYYEKLLSQYKDEPLKEKNKVRKR